MEQIAVIGIEKDYANYLKENLEEYLGKYAEIHAYSMSELNDVEYIQETYVVISMFTIFQEVKKKIKDTSKFHIISIALNKSYLSKLKKLPKNQKALLVNYDYRTCMQVIAQLYEAGFRDLDLVPYFGNENERDKSISIAVTPGEVHLVPEGIKNIIDIGQRVIDLNCIIDLADKMGIEGIFDSDEANEARSRIFFANSSIDRLTGENESLSGRMKILIELIDEGIILTDSIGRIYLNNAKASTFLHKRSDVLAGFYISEIMPEMNIQGIKDQKNGKEEIISVDGRNLIVSMMQIITGNEIRGYVVTLKNFEELEEKQHGIRSRLSEENHVAKYNFSDIKGTSTVIQDTIIIAKRMSKSDSSVLIIGESGTGKEVFAQSIHNGSKRSNYDFVAVNCAAIPENLLESEMFGYEEGSFTGARKGGKIGYFELAHKGTIFLDEIAEIPLLLQSKLLRVIEEKKVIKIGSRRTIDIDVRIIAATNKNLYELVQQGKFREDLYYRLNVLPLSVPPLRERDNDILILIHHFMNKMNSHFSLSNYAEKKLSQHNWRGNIRELRNTVEYLTNLEKDSINPDDIPLIKWEPVENDNFRNKNFDISDNINSSNTQDKHLIEKFLLQEGRKLDLYSFVLSNLLKAYEEKRRIGRNAIYGIAIQENKFISEQEVRNALRKLDDYGFILSERGRGGSTITIDGIELFKRINRLNW